MNLLLDLPGFDLGGNVFASLLLSLGLVNSLDQDVFVLELVALAFHVERMVGVLVNLLRGPVFSQQSSQNSDPSHPQHLVGHPRVHCTFSLSNTGMSSLSLRLFHSSHS